MFALPRAIILDVDGTMYAQGPLRARMAARLARAALASPRAGARWWRVLRAYRAAQEELRDAPGRPGGSAEDQIRLAVARSGVASTEAVACVARWMHDEPCGLLLRHRRPGLVEFLRAARSAGVRVGVFSDYPAAQKLAALEVGTLVDAVRCAHDADVGRFKPSPAGLLAVARALDVAPAECVYVGDRPEVDGAASVAAGMPGFIVGQAAAGAAGRGWEGVPDFGALGRRLAFR